MPGNTENSKMDFLDIKNNEDFLLIYPDRVSKDVTRSVNSLGFVDRDLPAANASDINADLEYTNAELSLIDRKLDELRISYKDVIDNLAYNLYFKDKALAIEENMAFGEKYFYFSAELDGDELKRMEEIERNNKDVMIASVNEVENKNKKNKSPNTNTEAPSEETYLLVYPDKVDKDIARTINTLGFIDNETGDGINSNEIDQLVTANEDELAKINEEISQVNSQYTDVIDNLAYSLDYQSKAEELKANMTHGKDYFYLSGWVPESELGDFKSLEDSHEKTRITVRDVDQVAEAPPTRLNNLRLFRPFEFLVNMYGAPSYDEIDPTPFFAITYMLLYGMMFGDLGQGLVFVALGFYLAKKNPTAGSLLKRIGLSASVFGLMYGSFFGREDLIPTLLIKPFDNIMTVLIASVAFGVSLMVISYIIGIYNKVSKQGNIEEGIFGKEGLAGLMMMISFILIILSIVGINPLPTAIGVIILVASIIMMIFKQPIARKLAGSNRLYDTGKGDYYVESSFSIIEALLSVFSNLVSFTRVGAFAINHVGLYMAFEVMAKLAGGGIIGFIILILGNVLIIGLEGMIVFIQGLRLEFYEMFSKYYEGNGRLFRPINPKVKEL